MPLHGDGVVCIEVSGVFTRGNNKEEMRSLFSTSPKHVTLHESFNLSVSLPPPKMSVINTA